MSAHPTLEAIAALVAVAEHGASVEARVAAVRAIANHLPDPEAVKALEKISQGDNMPEVITAVTSVLMQWC